MQIWKQLQHLENIPFMNKAEIVRKNAIFVRRFFDKKYTTKAKIIAYGIIIQ